MGCSVKIERAANGFEVCLRDPEIVKANAKADLSKGGKWRDPEREYVFTTIDEVLKFLGKHLDKALPADDYDTAFDKAVADRNEDDDA
jgi:hypothetical protein